MQAIIRRAPTDSLRPQREHTEIEEELHEVAHIDYNRVSIVSLSPPAIDVPGWFNIIDRQSLCCSLVRRCPGIWNRLSYHLDGSFDRILRSQDRPFATRQAYRQRRRLWKGSLVGSCQQAYVTSGQSEVFFAIPHLRKINERAKRDSNAALCIALHASARYPAFLILSSSHVLCEPLPFWCSNAT